MRDSIAKSNINDLNTMFRKIRTFLFIKLKNLNSQKKTLNLTNFIYLQTSEWFDNRWRTFFVSGGKNAKFGCGAIGASVPS